MSNNDKLIDKMNILGDWLFFGHHGEDKQEIVREAIEYIKAQPVPAEDVT